MTSAARTGRFTPWENPSTLPIRSAFAWFAYFAVPSAFSRLILARLRLTEFPRAWNLPSEGLRRGQPSRVGRPLPVCSGAASGEATENSPRFQPWECGQTIHKPRRGERAFGGSRNVFGRPSGTRFLSGDANPAMKRWAIVGCPRGTLAGEPWVRSRSSITLLVCSLCPDRPARSQTKFRVDAVLTATFGVAGTRPNFRQVRSAVGQPCVVGDARAVGQMSAPVGKLQLAGVSVNRPGFSKGVIG